MAYTEKTVTSWGSRIGSSFKGMVVALLLLVAGSFFLWNNEERSVLTGDAIVEAQFATVELPDVSKIDPSFNGKMVHATGFADTKDVLADSIFGVKTTAIKMERKSEYYQWVENSKSETREKLGGGTETVTTYTYKQEWVPEPVDSSRFRDPLYSGKNIVLTTVPGEIAHAGNVTMGAYRLPSFITNSISGTVPVSIDLTSGDIAGLSRQIAPPQTSSYGYSFVGAERSYVHVQSNTIYLGRSPASPRNGDVRVTFTEVRPAEISILARVINDTFEPFRASNGSTFSRTTMGTVGAENMFGSAVSGNKTTTWVLRFLGVLIIYVAFRMLMAPLSVLAGVIPILGTIVGAGTSLVAFLLGLAWSFLVIAVAWLRFRPLIGGSLLAVSVILLALLYVKGRKNKLPAV